MYRLGDSKNLTAMSPTLIEHSVAAEMDKNLKEVAERQAGKTRRITLLKL